MRFFIEQFGTDGWFIVRAYCTAEIAQRQLRELRTLGHCVRPAVHRAACTI